MLCEKSKLLSTTFYFNDLMINGGRCSILNENVESCGCFKIYFNLSCVTLKGFSCRYPCLLLLLDEVITCHSFELHFPLTNQNILKYRYHRTSLHC